MDGRAHGSPRSLDADIGASDSIRFGIDWVGEAEGGVSAATEGRMLAWVGDELVWGSRVDEEYRPIQWSLFELLDFLTRRWDWLHYDERTPANVSADSPSDIWKTVHERWDRRGDISEDEAKEVERFQATHDLSQAFRGYDIPELWWLRQGDRMIVDGGDDARVEIALETALGSLRRVGETIAERLEALSDPHADELLERWENRSGPASRQAAIYAGRFPDRDVPDSLWAASNNAPDASTFEPDEIFAAARQLGSRARDADIEVLADRISALEARETPELDDVAERLAAKSDNWQSDKPYTEGYHLAGRLRDYLADRDDHAPDARVDPGQILRDWNVAVDRHDFETNRFDAVSVWGERHGPGVIVNDSGQHAQQARGRRATLAHEICHLLVDRQAMLPLAEVLTYGSGPESIEQRARAFAAEFLLPRAVAAERAHRADGRDRAPEDIIDTLCGEYGVSREMAAWQVRNSEDWYELSDVWHDELRTMVGDPSAFE